MSDSVEPAQPKRKSNDRATLDAMLPVLYDELRRLARIHLNRERDDHTLQPTELAHEAYIQLIGQRDVDWTNRSQVLGIAATAIRRILLQHARNRVAGKRQGFANRIPLDMALDAVEKAAAANIEMLDDALTRLAQQDERMSRVVELRIFGGLNIEESAEALGVSAATVKRDWNVALLWLRRDLSHPG